MRLIDADKLKPDCLTKDGRLAISQSQIANAPTVKPNEEDITEIAPFVQIYDKIKSENI